MDGFELHLGHGHLLQQFLSPLSNTRTDAYGGSEDNRLRFPIAVLKAVRAAIGPHVAMGIRFSGSEFIEGGLTLADSLSMLPKIFAAVPLDFVNVSHSAYHMSYSLATQFADMHFDAAPFRELSREIRRVLRETGHPVPVMAAGKYRTVAEAEEALAGNVADMVGFARGHIADPELVAEVLRRARGRGAHVHRLQPGLRADAGEEPRHHLHGECHRGAGGGLVFECFVDSEEAGRHRGRACRPGSRGHGGGARARRDPAREVGRGGRAALVDPAHAGAAGLPRACSRSSSRARGARAWRCALASKRIRSLVKAMQPDVVMLATGSIPQRYPLALGGAALTLEEALAKPEALGRRVAFHDLTGEFASLGAIEHFADLGLSVTVFTPVAGFAWRTTIYSSLAARKRLRDKRVRIAPLRSVKGFADGELAIEDTSTGSIESACASTAWWSRSTTRPTTACTGRCARRGSR